MIVCWYEGLWLLPECQAKSVRALIAQASRWLICTAHLVTRDRFKSLPGKVLAIHFPAGAAVLRNAQILLSTRASLMAGDDPCHLLLAGTSTGTPSLKCLQYPQLSSIILSKLKQSMTKLHLLESCFRDTELNCLACKCASIPMNKSY
jgi:hypothetical protein